MISRIRIDAHGKSAEDVVNTLHPHAALIEQMLGVFVARGEEVIERQLNEPEGSEFAYKGRLLLHPDISGPAEGNSGNSTGGTFQLTGNGTGVFS